MAVDSYLEDNTFDTNGIFGFIDQNGYRAEYLNPIPAAETMPAMASFETGSYPSRHGIISNVFRLKGNNISETTYGYTSQFGSESIWEVAARQGKKVIRIGSIFEHGYKKSPNGVKTITQSSPTGYSKIVSLQADDSVWENYDGEHYDFIQPLMSEESNDGAVTLEIVDPREITLKIYALAVDTLIDGIEEYNAIILDDDKDLNNGFKAILSLSQWSIIEITKIYGFRIGTWIKILEFDSNSKLAKLYISAPQMNSGYPEKFISVIEDEMGLPPGGPDFALYNNGLLSESMIIEQIDREMSYVIKTALFAIQNMTFDLLPVDYPIMDRYGHNFMLTHTRQSEYDAESGRKRERFESYIKDAYVEGNNTLKMIHSLLRDSDAMIISSDYGLAPVYSRIAVNKILSDAGIEVTSDDKSEVRAYAGSTTANVYINLEGREPEGTVPENEYDNYVERIKSALNSYRDSETGEKVFDLVLSSEDFHDVGINGAAGAGDVWVRLTQ